MVWKGSLRATAGPHSTAIASPRQSFRRVKRRTGASGCLAQRLPSCNAFSFPSLEQVKHELQNLAFLQHVVPRIGEPCLPVNRQAFCLDLNRQGFAMELAQYHLRFQTLDSRFADDEFHDLTSAGALQIARDALFCRRSPQVGHSDSREDPTWPCQSFTAIRPAVMVNFEHSARERFAACLPNNVLTLREHSSTAENHPHSCG